MITIDRGETVLCQGATQNLDIKYVANNDYAQFQIWDFPGDYDTSSGEFKVPKAMLGARLRQLSVHDCLALARGGEESLKTFGAHVQY